MAFPSYPSLSPTRLGLAALALSGLLLSSCGRPSPAPAAGGKKAIVVTYSILGSLVSDLVGEAAGVKVLVPNGLDVHEWEPSARDMEALMGADLVVVNGLGLEGGLEKSLSQARAKGIPFFVAADHVQVRRVGEGEGIPSGDPDQAQGAQDPHIWTDPVAMEAVVLALAPALKESLGLEVQDRAAKLATRLRDLDREISAQVSSLAPARRRIVTGHESLGYFAQRYGFRLVGALVPSLSSEAETSAAWLSGLKGLMAQAGVDVIFTEVGTPPRLAQVLARETGARAIPLATHLLPPGGDYAAFERALAQTILKGLE